jgi:dihydroorotate dehydrogenase
MYKGLIRPLLFRLPPETAHQLTLHMIGLAGNFSPLRALLRSHYTSKVSKPVTIFGLNFPNQVGLAAGYDKDAQAILGLSALGFGHIEIGTVTPLPQAGNPKPRIFRLKQDHAIINRMGFPGMGADHCIYKLAKQAPLSTILGINIGKNKDTPIDQSVKDYSILIEKFSLFADYFAINISSPNTAGLRDLQRQIYLGSLLSEIKKVRDHQSQKHGKHLPLLVKLSPDMEIKELDQALDTILSNQLDGIIATNTTITREHLRSPAAQETGGLSGKPLSELSTQVIAHILKQTGGKIPIIGVGGISSPQEAQKKIDAGASLVQIYTGLIYQGPMLVRKIVESLASLDTGTT